MLRQTQSHRESTSETLQCCVSARFSNKQTDKVWDGLGLWTWHKENTAYESRGRDLDPARLTSGIFTREWNWFVLLTFSSFLRVHCLRLDNTGATLQLESTRWCSPLYKNLLRTCRMSIVRPRSESNGTVTLQLQKWGRGDRKLRETFRDVTVTERQWRKKKMKANCSSHSRVLPPHSWWWSLTLGKNKAIKTKQ